MVGGIISERRAASSRNGGRHHSGTVGGFPPESAPVAMIAARVWFLGAHETLPASDVVLASIQRDLPIYRQEDRRQ